MCNLPVDKDEFGRYHVEWQSILQGSAHFLPGYLSFRHDVSHQELVGALISFYENVSCVYHRELQQCCLYSLEAAARRQLAESAKALFPQLGTIPIQMPPSIFQSWHTSVMFKSIHVFWTDVVSIPVSYFGYPDFKSLPTEDWPYLLKHFVRFLKQTAQSAQQLDMGWIAEGMESQ